MGRKLFSIKEGGNMLEKQKTKWPIPFISGLIVGVVLVGVIGLFVFFCEPDTVDP
jgi:hypothetical protein